MLIMYQAILFTRNLGLDRLLLAPLSRSNKKITYLSYIYVPSLWASLRVYNYLTGQGWGQALYSSFLFPNCQLNLFMLSFRKPIIKKLLWEEQDDAYYS